jgi:hypothetical protein
VRRKSSRWIALVVLCTGMLMIVLDGTVRVKRRTYRQVTVVKEVC